jgi:hypothetical protein
VAFPILNTISLFYGHPAKEHSMEFFVIPNQGKTIKDFPA